VVRVGCGAEAPSAFGASQAKAAEKGSAGGPARQNAHEPPTGSLPRVGKGTRPCQLVWRVCRHAERHGIKVRVAPAVHAVSSTTSMLSNVRYKDGPPGCCKVQV